MSSSEADRVQAYLDTVARLEPDISPVDRDGALTSIAISLRRIADAMQELNSRDIDECAYCGLDIRNDIHARRT